MMERRVKKWRMYRSVWEPPTAVAGSWLVVYKFCIALVTAEASVTQARPSEDTSNLRIFLIVILILEKVKVY